MAKDKKRRVSTDKTEKPQKTQKPQKPLKGTEKKENGYFWSMSYAPKIDEGYHWLQVMPIVIWTAVIICIVQMASYERNMSQFFWTNIGNQLTDFFSYYKMVMLLVVAVIALLMLVFRFITQSFAIKKQSIYIPMIVYSLFVIISHIASDYKDFALLGYNDRFEGTLVLLAYMVMLFFIINTISNENHVKIVIYSVGITSALLGLLGITQSLDKDFFKTPLGQKLISPNLTLESGYTVNEMIDMAAENGEQFFNFTFTDQIYQTVYNINYVSFYLTLLIPLFGLIFIFLLNRGATSGKLKIVAFGLLFALLIYNLIGSASSGGFLGMAVVVLLAFVLLNKKIISWWKPVAILLVLTAIVGGVTFDRWVPEIKSALGLNAVASTVEIDESMLTGHLDYIDTVENEIRVSVNGEELTIQLDPNTMNMTVENVNDEPVALKLLDENTRTYIIDNEAFKNVTLQPAVDEERSIYLLINTNNPVEKQWVFSLTESGVYYRNEIGNLVDLDFVPAIGFEDNQAFGSGRGYIWSRTIPMMKETIFVGEGADTYCLFFPHNDYVGKYNARWDINLIVDKPHNMYMAMWTGTGMLSCLAFVAMVLLYAIQSFKVYWGRKLESFLDYAGVGIFLGIVGFAVTGLVDDSSVSVMPMFYGLLGTGIAINMIHEMNKEY